MKLVLRLSILFLMISTIAHGEEAKPYSYIRDVRDIRHDMSNMNQLDMAKKTDTAVANMVATATDQLHKAGHIKDADRITTEFKDKYEGYLTTLVKSRLNGKEEIGDHAPYSKFLADLYDLLYAALGEQVMKLTHLEDIKVINFTIPVVFHLSLIKPNEINATEYEKHWSPFWGVVTYWTVWGACTAVTYGGGWFVICSPAGMVAKYVVVNYVAPKFSDNGFKFFYGPNLSLPGRIMQDNLGCIGINVLDLCKL